VVQSQYGQLEVRDTALARILLIDGLPQTGMPARLAPGDGVRYGTPVNVLICCDFRIYGITPSSVCGVTDVFWKQERQGCCWVNHLRRSLRRVRSV
jgi:hypothetical protein